MSSERPLTEILSDPDLMGVYVGVRRRKENGQILGEVVASGRDYDSIHGAIRIDKLSRGGLYHLFFPVNEGEDRKGWIIGEEELFEKVVM